MATAKGIASALKVALVGVSTLDTVAWNAQTAGVRGLLLVAADAMRKEVYPVRYALDETGAHRLEADRVIKALEVPAAMEQDSSAILDREFDGRFVSGDALTKYEEVLSPLGEILPEKLWEPTGEGLLLAVQALWRTGEADPFDAVRHNPAFALPVYTRLSDAEENERIRLAKNDPKNLRTGVQDVALRRDQRASMHDTAILNARPDAFGITYKPLDAAHASEVATLETRIMGSDAWNERLVADELPRADRTWWAAYASAETRRDRSTCRLRKPSLALRWEVRPSGDVIRRGRMNRRHRSGGVVAVVVSRGSCFRASLRMRATWGHRHARSRSASATWGRRRSTGRAFRIARKTSATIPTAKMPSSCGVLAVGASRCGRYGAQIDNALRSQEELLSQASGRRRLRDPLRRKLHVVRRVGEVSPAPEIARLGLTSVLAIESSGGETHLAAIVDGEGNLVADVVASQIDFHSRFGGVVPEIASRKHIEAICGVCDECFEAAAKVLGVPQLTWHDLDAVGVTYAPGLLGALVVGVAFAKGAAWAAD